MVGKKVDCAKAKTFPSKRLLWKVTNGFYITYMFVSGNKGILFWKRFWWILANYKYLDGGKKELIKTTL